MLGNTLPFMLDIIHFVTGDIRKGENVKRNTNFHENSMIMVVRWNKERDFQYNGCPDIPKTSYLVFRLNVKGI